MDTLEHTQYTEEDIKDNSFRSLKLAPELIRAISELGYETPTPIQAQAIPLVLEGNDLMGLAQTGTGKTAAFGLPLVHQLLKKTGRPEPKTVKALILAPTRELVNQIAENLRQYVKKTPLRINLVIGGQSINNQIRNVSRGTDILIATPGRLLDLVDRKALYLDSVKYLVLDEADQMLDLGFIHSLRKISKMLGKPRQTMLFSATMPKPVEDLSKAFLEDPVKVQVSPPGRAADKIKQCVFYVQQRDKTELLKDCLIKHPDDLSLVFARTKHGAEKLMKHLVQAGFKANSIHGNKSQGQRDRALRDFKSGDTKILVATDVAARGIDIPGVGQVYNYNLPEVPENYVHRIGRTARAGAEGEGIAFCAPDEAKMLRAIQKLMGITIEVAGGVEPEWQQPAAKGKSKTHRKGQSAGRGTSRSKPKAKKPPESAPVFDIESGRKEGSSKPQGNRNAGAQTERAGSDQKRRKPKRQWDKANDGERANTGDRRHAASDERSSSDKPRKPRPQKPHSRANNADKSAGSTDDTYNRSNGAGARSGEAKPKGAPGGKKQRWTSKQKQTAKKSSGGRDGSNAQNRNDGKKSGGNHFQKRPTSAAQR